MKAEFIVTVLCLVRKVERIKNEIVKKNNYKGLKLLPIFKKFDKYKGPSPPYSTVNFRFPNLNGN